MSRRILTIAAAVLLAVLGAVGVLVYVHRADQRALAGMRAVTAYVATAQIPAGTPAAAAVQQGLLVSKRFPASSVPSDAVHSITGSVASLVLTGGLTSGQMLLSPMLGSAEQTAAALPIPAGMVAVTLQFCVVQAVGNYVTPGSEVAVFNTFVNGGHKIANVSCSAAGSNSAVQTLQTRLVLAKVLVLAVGEGTATPPAQPGTADASSSSSSGSTPSTIYVTLAVSQADAERLIELGEGGSPYLALVTSASKTKADISFQP